MPTDPVTVPNVALGPNVVIAVDVGGTGNTPLHDLLVAATKSAGAVKFYESTGVDPVVSSPEELAKFQAAESQKWGRIGRQFPRLDGPEAIDNCVGMATLGRRT